MENNENNKKKIIIKKKSQISDKNNENNEASINNENNVDDINKEKEDFGKLLEESSIQEQEIHNNQIVEGVIVEIREDVVFVDVGYKSEGIIKKEEFKEEPKIGQELEVFVVKKENEEGDLVLSKTKAESIKTRRMIEDRFSNEDTIKGTVEKEIKGGFIVNIGADMEAFVPMSQMDIRKINKPSEYIDKTFDFKITKYDKRQKQTNIVMSRRVLLEEQLKKEKEKLLSEINEGDTIEGTVKTILDYGMFINIGPLDGFVHLKDMSWGHITHPKHLFNIGDKVKVKILEINRENEKISMGIKQLTEDPWNTFIKEYKKGDVVKGEVTKLFDYGAFVKIFQGVEGLLHVSEMSWTKRVNHPKEILKKGDILETKILEIDEENKKLSLGLKQVLDNPWEKLDELLPVGEKVKGKVKNVIKSGVFIELKEGLEGFLPQSEINWSKKSVNTKREFKKNDDIEVVILNTNPKEKKITLSRKQLVENPYETYINNHPKGGAVKGKVTKITNFGAFVRLDKGIEGLIPISHVSKKRIEKVDEVLKVGDDVNTVIIDYDLRDNKITLSIKNYEKSQERKEIEKYTISSSEDNEKVTLGDIINIDMDKLNKEEDNEKE